LVHYILDGLTLCGDPLARSWTEEPQRASCAACRLILWHVGAYRAAEGRFLETPVPQVTPIPRVRLR
jgi:hypothetical protein